MNKYIKALYFEVLFFWEKSGIKKTDVERWFYDRTYYEWKYRGEYLRIPFKIWLIYKIKECNE